VLLPALLTLVVAFTDWDGATTPVFVGLKNFGAVFSDPIFWGALFDNVQWTVIFLTIPMAIAMIAAAILMNARRAAPSSRSSSCCLTCCRRSPTRLSGRTSSSILSRACLGFISRNCSRSRTRWTDTRTALYAVAGVDIWHFWATSRSCFFAAMRQTPEDQLEAAFIEGANGWQVFRNVTLPNILPTVALMFVLVTIFSFLTFDYIYLITQGGPARSTEMLSTFAYAFAFTKLPGGQGRNGCAGDELLRPRGRPSSM